MPLVFETNAASLVGNVIGGRYKLLELLGVGGTGAVFRAKQIHLQAVRAVKIMLSRHSLDPILVKRFLREARGLARLDHPNVVRVVDTGETEEGLPFIAMELLEGEALSTTLKREGSLPWPAVKHIACQVCNALQAAHEAGIIHRDLKPDNCFRLYDDEDGYRVKLLDFGIARFESDEISRITEQGSVLGTTPYMSCEQIAGAVCDRQTDIWSIAVVFYELLCGVRPFQGLNAVEVSRSIANDDPSKMGDVRPDLELPPSLEEVLAKAMAKDRKSRYPTMKVFLGALEAVPAPVRLTQPFTRSRNRGTPEARPDFPKLPTSLGHYKICRQIGDGAMGIVYEAMNEELDRRVALKVMRQGEQSPEQWDRFRREAKALARLSHPNIVGIYDIGTHQGQVYSIMEFIDGVTLAQWLNQSKQWREVTDVFIAAGRGLAAAHAAGLVHRDFKPGNVMLTSAGQAKLLDFGLVRALAGAKELSNLPDLASVFERPLTKSGTLIGTPAYMAPEQIDGTPSGAQTDQFSFCVALYEAIYGYRPFQGERWFNLTANILEGNIRLPPDKTQVPPKLFEILKRGLSVKPNQRWATMKDLLNALERVSEGRAEPKQSLLNLAWVGIAATIVAVTIGIWLVQ